MPVVPPETEPLKRCAATLADLILEASELINVKVRLNHVAYDFEASISSGNLGTREAGFAISELFFAESEQANEDDPSQDGQVSQPLSLGKWLTNSAIPKLVNFAAAKSFQTIEAYGVAEAADFCLVSSEAPIELKKMVSLATDGKYFVFDRSQATISSSRSAIASARAENDESQTNRLQDQGSQADRCHLTIFGCDQNTINVLNAAAELARIDKRSLQYTLAWNPAPSSVLVSLQSGDLDCEIHRAEQFKGASDVWRLIREPIGLGSKLTEGRDTGLRDAEEAGQINIIADKSSNPPEEVYELLRQVKDYVRQTFPKYATRYSFKEAHANSGGGWLLVEKNGELKPLKNGDLMLSARELFDLFRKRLSASRTTFFLAEVEDKSGTSDPNIPTIFVSGAAPDFPWVKQAMKSRLAEDQRSKDVDSATKGSVGDENFESLLHHLAWLRRLESAAQEVAEQTLTDHVAHARWEQARFDLRHRKQNEDERTKIETINRELLSLPITLSALAPSDQAEAVEAILVEINRVQKDEHTLGDPKAKSEAICSAAIKKVNQIIESEDKIESKKSTREAVTEAITSALQAPMRFVLPFAFLIVPFIVLIFHVDPSKNDNQILQSTVRAYGFMLLPIFFFVAAASRFLALQDKKARRKAKLQELLRAELLGAITTERADLILRNTREMEQRIEKRVRLREEEGTRIGRRLSSLENVRSRIQASIKEARQLRDSAFDGFPTLRLDLSGARSGFALTDQRKAGA